MANKLPAKQAEEVINEIVSTKQWKDRNSPVLGNAGELFTDSDEKRAYVAKTMNEVLEYWDVPKVSSTEDAIERTKQYFQRCAERGIKPLVEEYAMCLGITRQTLWEWETGKYRAPLDPYVIKRAKDAIAMYDAKAVIDGKLNPVTYIFRGKNYYGLKDQQDVVVTPNTLEARPKQELIEAALELPED